ncbi:ABC transporter permease [Thermodesulfobacteriota bacterium]
MTRYLLSRLLQAFMNILFVATVIFFLVRLSGSPEDILVSDRAGPGAAEYIRQHLGLDKPLYQQYGIYLKNLASGDLGVSIRDQRPVTTIILERLPATASLAVVSMCFAIILALPLGVLSAVHRDSNLDRLGKLIALLGQSAPQFWIGLMMMLVFAVVFRILPVAGRGGPLTYVLPGLTLGWFVAAGIMRLTRSSMLDVLDSEFVTLARVKGVPEWVIIWKHALRNALIPVVTYLGLTLASFMNGSVVVETVFAWPGLGRLALEAVMARDYPVIQGVVISVCFLFIVINLLVDLIYMLINPQIRYAKT